MLDLDQIRRHLDRIYSELAELRRYLILHSQTAVTGNDQAWQDLVEASREVSALWTGPSAAEEIRAQREK
jgi:hypothetical protein